MIDRFEELMSKRTAVRVFAPGTAWRAFGHNEILRRALGDDFPTFFVPLEVEPPPFADKTQYTYDSFHFGVHAFITFRAKEAGTSWQASIAGVSAFCLHDAASREALGHLVETTRDAHGGLGGLPVKMRFAAARVPRTSNFIWSSVHELPQQHLVNALQLWNITPAAERASLKDDRCPLCRVTGA